MDIFNSWLTITPIAHRGLHTKDYPENSMGAFQNAIKKGYTIELDVHLLKDGKIAVFHDDNVSRMTGINAKIKNLTSEEVKHLKLADTEFTIPLFDEVLELVNGKVPLLIETKTDRRAGKLEKVLYERLKSYNGEFVVQSFSPFSLSWFKKNAPDVWRGQLAGSFTQDDVTVSSFTRFILKRMLLNKISKPNFISYEANCLPNKYVDKYKNLPVLAWVVQNEKEQKRVSEHCNNIIFENFEPKVKQK